MSPSDTLIIHDFIIIKQDLLFNLKVIYVILTNKKQLNLLMKKTRVIARLDVKGPNVIKGVHLECLRIIGRPNELAEKYYLQGADELLYIDIVASLYRRQNLLDIVDRASDQIFIPFTVGGGVRTIADIKEFLKSGADKVAINTAIIKRPELITEGAKMFGSQCIVASIEAKRVGEKKWEAYTDNGREKTGYNVIEWAKEVEERGAGEILLTSIDTEGTKKGYDLDLIKIISKNSSIPVIASGGAGNPDHIATLLKETETEAAAVASILHYNSYTIGQIKEVLTKNGIEVRKNGQI